MESLKHSSRSGLFVLCSASDLQQKEKEKHRTHHWMGFVLELIIVQYCSLSIIMRIDNRLFYTNTPHLNHF